MDERFQADLRAAYRQAQAALAMGQDQAAERQLRAIQQLAPGDVNSLRLLGAALLGQGRVREAIAILESVITRTPAFAAARIDLARAYRHDSRIADARGELRRVLSENPSMPAAWLAYGDTLYELELFNDARLAFEQARRIDPQRERIQTATSALTAGRTQEAEGIFRDILKSEGGHLEALCGLAAVALTAGETQDSERLLRHALRQSTYAPLVMRGLGHTLLAANRLPEAQAMLQRLLKIEPENPQNWVALGSVYTRSLRQEEALAAYEEAARLNPSQLSLRHSIGHILKTLGRRGACEEAYLSCLRQDAGFAEVYWSLADLKNYEFSHQQFEAMQRLLEAPPRTPGATSQLHFALGRAYEQRGCFTEAFTHYAAGNGLRRAASPFSISHFEAKTRRVIQCFDRDFFAARRDAGCAARAPVFIVGLPRSGSTLVEQILASHSCVEGTMELINIPAMVRELDRREGRGDEYPESCAQLPREELSQAGQRYLSETRPIRTGRELFIDKMPNNFSHVGLIHAILPNAVIIDVRRHPMDACLSTFKQHFAEGQSFSYDLRDLGRYYRCYLSLMDHWDEVLPGKVLHLSYEVLVRNPEVNIRRLLEHCGLSFEPACLSFHRTARAVRTASSEQVRQPLYATGIGYWKHFEAHLEPLRASLGDCLARFEPDA